MLYLAVTLSYFGHWWTVVTTKHNIRFTVRWLSSL